MEKILLLKLCIYVNIGILFLSILSFFVFNNVSSSYFSIGWSDNFIFVSVIIDTPLKYFILCLFIIILNVSEIFLNDLASPLIQFSTYNPYKIDINDFSRFELEAYSNVIFFIQICKRFLIVVVTLSQIDIAVISLVSSQISASFVIHYLLDQKKFLNRNVYVEVPHYGSIDI